MVREEQRVQVLFQSENFVIINKPADLRMDGDFDTTVEKVLQRMLGKPTKWVHQLDYATSGVLCVALNRQAAAQATAAFERRQTQKVYLAVLEGHLNPYDWPLKEFAPVPQPIPYSPKSSKKRKTMPNERSETWQDRALHQSLDLYYEALTKLIQCPDTIVVSQPQEKDSVCEQLRAISKHSKLDFEKNKKLRKQLRKLVSSCGIQIPSIVEEDVKASIVSNMASEESHIEDGIMIEEGDDDSLDWRKYGTIYREERSLDDANTDSFFDCTLRDALQSHAEGSIITTDAKGKNVIVSNKERKAVDVLHVDIPIADGHADNFCMSLGKGSEALPGRSARTEITVLEHGHHQSSPVTKVLLRPISGRRHQLRLHSLATGHGILGDFTYGRGHGDGLSPPADRMMLHAFRLSLDLSGCIKKRDEELCDGGKIEGNSQDPFVFIKGCNSNSMRDFCPS